MTENGPIKSFVRRDSRITRAQRLALDRNLDNYALPTCADAVDLGSAFGRRAPCTLEIGSGDGECIVELAKLHSDENFVAVEVYRPGLGRLLNLIEAEKLTNIRVCNEDIIEVLPRITDEVFDQVLIFFPDPWPKKRHNKRRLLQQTFFDVLAPRVHRHGRLFIATDSETYAQSIKETIEDSAKWGNLSGPWHTSPRVNFRPVTKFERKARVAESHVYDFIFSRS